MANDGGGQTVTFESVDGPPPGVFDRMVSVLDSETKLRNLSIVSRESPASYRVRSYLSAQVVRGRTVIAWVWDVYDRNQQRAVRLSGEEQAGKAGRDATRDPWAAADDLVLRKIAQAGLEQLGHQRVTVLASQDVAILCQRLDDRLVEKLVGQLEPAFVTGIGIQVG